MAMNPKSTITFIKILICEFTTQIKLPPFFVKLFEKIIPKICTLKSHTGKSTQVSVISSNNGCFFKQGWDKFVKENELKEGDILVFNLVDETTFEVFAYAPTCCLKKIQQEPQFHQTPTHPQTKNTTPKKRGRKPGFSPLNTESGNAKRGKRKDHPQSNNENGNAKWEKKVMKESNNEKSEEQVELHSAVLTLKKYQKHNVSIPRSFASKAGLTQKKKILIEDPEGRKWPLDLWVSKQQTFLSTGWGDFYKANGLITGDTCILHCVPGKTNFIGVEILKSGSRDAARPSTKF